MFHNDEVVYSTIKLDGNKNYTEFIRNYPYFSSDKGKFIKLDDINYKNYNISAFIFVHNKNYNEMENYDIMELIAYANGGKYVNMVKHIEDNNLTSYYAELNEDKNKIIYKKNNDGWSNNITEVVNMNTSDKLLSNKEISNVDTLVDFMIRYNEYELNVKRSSSRGRGSAPGSGRGRGRGRGPNRGRGSSRGSSSGRG